MDRQVPRAPLPGRSVPSAGAMSCIASKGITLSSLLIRAHAPAQLSSAYFSLGLVGRIFAGYCQFLLRVGPSRRISASPCLDVWTSATVGYGVLLLVASSISSAFPNG